MCDCRLRQGRLHREDAVPGEGRADGLWVGPRGEQELAVVLAVDGLAVALLLVLCVDLTEGGGKKECLCNKSRKSLITAPTSNITSSLLSTVLTMISSGEYSLTSNLSLSSFCLTPLWSESLMRGESRPWSQLEWSPRPEPDRRSPERSSEELEGRQLGVASRYIGLLTLHHICQIPNTPIDCVPSILSQLVFLGIPSNVVHVHTHLFIVYSF